MSSLYPSDVTTALISRIDRSRPPILSKPGVGLQLPKDSHLIWTPFYQTIPDVGPGKCDEQPLFTYSPYLLFVLRSRLITFLQNLLHKNIGVQFPIKRRENRFYVTVVPTQGGKAVLISRDEANITEKFIANLTPEQQRFVILFTNDLIQSLNNKLIHSSWISQVLPFLQLDSLVRPQIGPNGIEIDLSKVSNYDQWYQTLVVKVVKQLRSMYAKGYLVDPPESLIHNWRLVPVELKSFTVFNEKTGKGLIIDPTKFPIKSNIRKSRLYYANWADGRITGSYGGMTGFLLSCLAKEPAPKSDNLGQLHGPLKDHYIDYALSSDSTQTDPEAQAGSLVKRHFIARLLGQHNINLIFHGNWLRFQANDLNQTQFILALITEAIGQAAGKVITFMVTRPSWLKLYQAVSRQLGFKDCVGYRIDDPQRPYLFSCIIDSDLNLVPEYREFRAAATELLNILNAQLTDKTMSIHEAIERNLVIFE